MLLEDEKKGERVKASFSPPKDSATLKKTAKILKISLDQKRLIPDGSGGVMEVSGKPNDCLGPILLHLHQNAWRKGVEKLSDLTGEVSVVVAVPYYQRMSLVELLSHMAEARMLPDWSYLVLHHQNLADALMIPYVAADAVLRNGWGVREYSILNNLVRNHFAPAYDKLLGEKLSKRDVLLYYSLEESPVGVRVVEENGKREHRLLFNIGSSVFTAKDLIDSANAAIPIAFGQMLTHKLLDYRELISAEAFKDGGTHTHLPETDLGMVLPEVDFKLLSEKSGLSEDDLMNMLHRLAAAKLGLEFAKAFVYGGEEMTEARKRDEYVKAFNRRIDALLRSASAFKDAMPTDLRRLLMDGYGEETPERLRWDLTLACVDSAVLEEHKEAVSDGGLKSEVQERLSGEKIIVGKYIAVLGDSFDVGGLVSEFRRIHRAIKVELS